MNATTQTTTLWTNGSPDMLGVRICADMARRAGAAPNSNGSMALDLEPMLDEAINATLAWADSI